MATLLVSDLHIGDGKSKYLDFLAYLEKTENIDKLVLVGDTFDFWVSGLDNCLELGKPLIDYVVSRFGHDNLHILVGNHDASLFFLRDTLPFIHKSLRFPVGDKIAVCLHGNVLDDNPYLKTRFSHYMAWFINKFDAWAKIDTRKSLVSLSERIKDDPYDKVIADYEQKIADVFDGKFDYVITGHTHLFPYIKKLNNLIYFNIGDSMQHSTLLIAKKDGFYLYDYIANKTIDAHKV
jgi:UDP-2,3-diacylglucosamine pyrophosphatase LpxH